MRRFEIDMVGDTLGIWYENDAGQLFFIPVRAEDVNAVRSYMASYLNKEKTR